MPYFTYDTSVIVSRKLSFHEMPRNFVLSAIVMMELMSSAADSSRRKSYERSFRQFQGDNLLIVPNGDWADFKAIQRYCNATIIKAAQFFKN